MEHYIAAALMGMLEAATEFLPVSSTGHLLLASHFFGFNGGAQGTFEVAIQLGAILAVVVFYFAKLWDVLVGLPTDPMARRFALAVLIAFFPAALIGVMFHDVIKAVLFNPYVVCWALLVGGIAMLWLDRHLDNPRFHSVDDVPLVTALKVGLVQCLAMIPGVSRSGATIIGGLLLGMDRKTAAEFSFFLSIPTIGGAAVFDMLDNKEALLNGGQWDLIAVGLVAAFIGAIPVVKGLIGFISRHGFAPFAWYRIGAGTLGLALLYLGF